MENRAKLEELFKEYEKLAYTYASRVNQLEKLGFEYEDTVQELKLKIWLLIQSYLKKVEEYKKTGKYRPVPLLYYIKAGIINKLRDWITVLQKKGNLVSFGDIEFDIGREDSLQLNFRDKEVVVNGIDVLQGLERGFEQGVFCMYLKGYSIDRIKATNKRKGNEVPKVIREQLAKLRQQKDDLCENHPIFVCTYELEEQ